MFRTDGVHLSSQLPARSCASAVDAARRHRFAEVIRACASAPRPGQDGTWITDDMIDAYVELHRLGHAHSIEVFDGDRLVGGIYGVAIGRMFFGESMFSAEPGASKVALAALAAQLARLGLATDRRPGARMTTPADAGRRNAWPRRDFLQQVAQLRRPAGDTRETGPGAFGLMAAATWRDIVPD